MEHEVIEVELRRGDSGLGFNIRGGVDIPHIPEDAGVFISKIRELGAAASDGRLKEGDKILEVNGTVVGDITHTEAVNLFIEAGEVVKLKVWPGAERHIKIKKTRESRAQSNTDSKIKFVIYVSGAVTVGILAFYVYQKLKK